jgi:hypothetical protein
MLKLRRVRITRLNPFQESVTLHGGCLKPSLFLDVLRREERYTDTLSLQGRLL